MTFCQLLIIVNGACPFRFLFILQVMTVSNDRTEDADLEKDIENYNRSLQHPNVAERVRQLVSTRRSNELKPQHVSFAFNPQYSISTPSLSSVPQIVISNSPLQQSNNSQGLAQTINMPSTFDVAHTSPPATPTMPSPIMSEDIDYTPRTSIEDYERQRRKYKQIYNTETDDEDDRMSNVDTLYGSASVYSEDEEDEPVASISCRCCPSWWLQRSKIFRSIVTNALIFIVIFVPGLVTRLVLSKDYLILDIAIDRWTEFLCLVFFGLHVSRLFVYIILKISWLCTAGKAQTRIEMLQFVQINIALCVWSVVCLSGWHYIIKAPSCPDNQCGDVGKLFAITGNAIESLVCACFAFCLERIALTQVSTVFKKGAYHDRIVQCRFESDMIEAMLKCRHIDRVERKIAKLQNRRPSGSDMFDQNFSNASMRHNFGQVLKSQPEYPSQLIKCSSESQTGAAPSIATRISVELEEKLRKPSKAGLIIPECLLDGNSSQYGDRKQTNINMTLMAKYIRQIRSKKLLNVISSIEDSNKYAKKIFFRICPRNRNYIVLDDFQRVFHSKHTQEFAFQLLDKDMDGKVTLTDMREGKVILASTSETKFVDQYR